MLRHRMMACCEPSTVKIRGQALFVIHWIERREKGRGIGIVCSDMGLEKSACGTAGAFDLPQSAAAMDARFAGNKIQSANAGENAHFIFFNLRHSLL